MSDEVTNTILLSAGPRGRELAETLACAGPLWYMEGPTDRGRVSMRSCGTGESEPVSALIDRGDTEAGFNSLLQAIPDIDTFVVMPPAVTQSTHPTEFSAFTDLFEKHFFTLLAGIKSVLPRMVKARRGRIVVILPRSALVACSEVPAATCAHWALKRVCQSLRAETERLNVGTHLLHTSLGTEFGDSNHGDHARELERLCSTIARLSTEKRGTRGVVRLRDRSSHLVEQLFPYRRRTGSRNGHDGTESRATQKIQSILITGASSGLGRELARLYAGFAERLCLVGRNLASLHGLRDELLSTRPIRVDVAAVDLSDLEGVSDFARASDRVDVLVNCAGFSVTGAVRDVPLRLFRKNMTVNFLAPVLLTEALCRKEPPPRRIVNILSTTAIAGRSRQASYSATKAALWAQTKIWRQIAPPGTTVTAVLPATFASEFADNAVVIGANGNPEGSVRSATQNHHGQTSRTVAARILRASRRGRRRVFIPHKARLFHLLEATSPRLFQRMFP